MECDDGGEGGMEELVLFSCRKCGSQIDAGGSVIMALFGVLHPGLLLEVLLS